MTPRIIKGDQVIFTSKHELAIIEKKKLFLNSLLLSKTTCLIFVNLYRSTFVNEMSEVMFFFIIYFYVIDYSKMSSNFNFISRDNNNCMSLLYNKTYSRTAYHVIIVIITSVNRRIKERRNSFKVC